MHLVPAYLPHGWMQVRVRHRYSLKAIVSTRGTVQVHQCPVQVHGWGTSEKTPKTQFCSKIHNLTSTVAGKCVPWYRRGIVPESTGTVRVQKPRIKRCKGTGISTDPKNCTVPYPLDRKRHTHIPAVRNSTVSEFDGKAMSPPERVFRSAAAMFRRLRWLILALWPSFDGFHASLSS